MGVASGRTFLGIWASEALAVGVSYSLIRIRQKPYQFSIGRYWRKAVVRIMGGYGTVDAPCWTSTNHSARSPDALWRLLAVTASAAEEQFTNANAARDRTPPPPR